MQRGSMNSLRQETRSEGSLPTEARTSPIAPAHASRAPFGTCCRVGTLVLKMDSREGRASGEVDAGSDEVGEAGG